LKQIGEVRGFQAALQQMLRDPAVRGVDGCDKMFSPSCAIDCHPLTLRMLLLLLLLLLAAASLYCSLACQATNICWESSFIWHAYCEFKRS